MHVFWQKCQCAAAPPVSLGLHVHHGALRNGTMHFIMLPTLRNLSLMSSAHPPLGSLPYRPESSPLVVSHLQPSHCTSLALYLVKCNIVFSREISKKWIMRPKTAVVMTRDTWAGVTNTRIHLKKSSTFCWLCFCLKWLKREEDCISYF